MGLESYLLKLGLEVSLHLLQHDVEDGDIVVALAKLLQYFIVVYYVG